jgi:Bacteriophage terminase large (ATPase) subunit and inactivated derivatives
MQRGAVSRAASYRRKSKREVSCGRDGMRHARNWRYPDWWKGRRFDKPTIGWGAGTTNETTRDTVQRILVGRPGQPGTAAIPKDAIIDLVSARGTPDLLDSIKVTHVSGGVSVIGLKSYQRGRESFQGETLDYLWFDEEPPPTSSQKVYAHERQSGTGVGNVYAPARHVGDGAAVLAGAVARSQRHDDDDRRRRAFHGRGKGQDHRKLSGA